VSKFCSAIASAGIRDRFYRLNLFCGSNLNAALVPLYLTPDKTVTNLFQFGTDQTNAAWLPGGNGSITRTATTEVGPLGYGYATKLTTPSAPFDIRQMQQQMPLDGRQVTVSAWMKTNSGTRQIQWLTGNVYSDTVTVTTTWQRFTKTFTLPTSTDARTGFSTVSELSDAAGFIYVWGMQCEYGATATSYNQPRYGNTTDTNNAFVGVGTDYAETGATGGLTGNGTSKYLDTGFPMNTLPSTTSGHAAVYCRNRSSSSSFHGMVGVNLAGGSGFGVATDGTVYAQWGAFANVTNNANGLLVASRTSATSLVAYAAGTAIATNSTSTTPTASTLNAAVFVSRNTTTSNTFFDPRTYGFYSIGTGLSAAEVTSLTNAVNAFQSALGRA
jgi:hypothetical protein